MPMYEFRCQDCNTHSDGFRKILERDRPTVCYACGGLAFRILSAPRILSDYAGYACPITGEWVEGRKAHRENLARHGCRILEPGEKEAAQRHRARSDAALEASLEATVEAEIHNMTPQKRDALSADLEHFSADIVRT